MSTRTVKTGWNTSCPSYVAVAPNGHLLITNGIQAPQRFGWDTAALEKAGVSKATNSFTVTLSSPGADTVGMVGTYAAAIRYLDDSDQPGDLSEIKTFTVSTTNNLITYNSLPTSTSARTITKREIYRSTAGQETVFYLDVTLNDNTTTTATSSKTDDLLSDQTALPILNPDGHLHARRFGIPPATKLFVVQHKDRMFFGGSNDYSRGTVSFNASAPHYAQNADLTTALVGRTLYVNGAQQPYTVSAIDPAAQSFTVTPTLEASLQSTTHAVNTWKIGPSQDERGLIRYSEDNEPESVPESNSIRLQEDAGGGLLRDDANAGIPFSSFIYFAKEHSTHRLTFTISPECDGSVYHSHDRGCLNQNCWVRVDNLLYCLDRQGIYAFNGSGVDPISQPIQDVFRQNDGDITINWTNAKWFHATYDQQTETVKFFVCLDSSDAPMHALCFHHRTRRFWTERKPWTLRASDQVPLGNESRLAVGGEDERILLTGEGFADGPAAAVSYRPTVTAASGTTVTMTTALTGAAADYVGTPLYVVEGTGKGQVRNCSTAISLAGGILGVSPAWNPVPANGSVIQVGAIDYRVKFGRETFAHEEGENIREVRVQYKPTSNANSFDLRIYEDFKSQPSNQGINHVRNDGVESEEGSPDIVVRMTNPRADASTNSGFARFTYDGSKQDWSDPNRYAQLEIRGAQNQEQVKFRRVVHRGVNK